MKIYFLHACLIILALFGSNNVSAQNYYWVGTTGGNWSDLSNWSNSSGGAGGFYATPPGALARVRFDVNSFSSPGQVVNYDMGATSIKSMFWTTGVNAPQFLSGSANDSISINGSLILDPLMDYDYGGKLIFKGGNNDSIVTGGIVLLNDIVVNTFGTNLKLNDNLTTIGGFYYLRGGLYLNDRTVNCSFFNADQGTTRTLNATNTTINLSGLGEVIKINPGGLTKVGTNEVFNSIYTGTDTISVSFGGTGVLWNAFNIGGENCHFTTSCNLSTLQSTTLKLIRLGYNQSLKCANFNINGNCGKTINLSCLEGVAFTDNTGTPWNLDYFTLKNINASGVADVATNSLDNGGNVNWTITENAGVNTYYWVNGTGSFYDPTHWAVSSGGVADPCVPGPNDIAIFDAGSGTIDTLFVNSKVIIGELNFQNIPGPCVVAGTADTIEVRVSLTGSSNLQFDWNGITKMTSAVASTITSNGAVWNSDFVKSGSAALNFTDAFTNNRAFYHNNGLFDANGNLMTMHSFYSLDISNARVIDFTGTIVDITGTSFEVDQTLLTLTNPTSELRFTNSSNENVLFSAGDISSYDTVRIQTATVEIASSSVDYNFLDINAGSTVIFDNSSAHTYDSIRAPGTCASTITLKSSNSLAPAAVLGRTANVLTTLDYAIIDHLDADAVGLYIANSSLLLNGSANWIAASTPGVATINFSVNDTILPGTTTSIIGVLPAIPANATIMSSVLTLSGVYTTGGTDIFECEVALSGESILAQAYLTGAAGNATNLTFNLNTTTLPGAGGNVTLDLISDTTPFTSPFGEFIVASSVLTVNYLNSYDPLGNTYYWYGDAGDWSDVSHWSLNSGNIPPAPATCLPGVRDTVIFDDNSFSIASQTVIVDQESYFSKMDWSLSTNQPTLLMDKSLTSTGDVTLEAGMTITRTNTISNLLFQPDSSVAIFDTDLTLVEVPIVFLSDNDEDTLRLANNLITSDSVVVIIGGGIFFTDNFDIQTGSFLIGSSNIKEINLGSSLVSLRNGFSDDSFGGLTFNAQTSTIKVDDNDQVFSNFFRSSGIAFNNVDLEFNSTNFSEFTGSNSFNSFIVRPGSKLLISAGTTQTINGDFIMNGNCQDSIYLTSSTPGSQYFFINPADSLQAQCLSVQDANAGGAGTYITYFSTNVSGNNATWNFDAQPSATASILTAPTNYCFGDTLQFVNNSTAFQGDNGNLTYYWNFGDGTTHIGDTTQHEYLFSGTYQLELVAEYQNLCLDTLITTVNILNPNVAISSSELYLEICAGDSISFYAQGNPITVDYEFLINGISQGPAAPLNDTLISTTFSNLDTVSVMVFQNGCPATSDSLIVSVNPLPLTTITSSTSSTICAGDSVYLNGLNADLYEYYLNGVPVTAFISDSILKTNILNGDQFYAIGKIDSSACTTLSDTITFTVNPLPTVTLTENSVDFIICAGESVTFTATPAPSATQYDFYVNGALANTSASPTWITTSLLNGNVVTVIAENASGCRSLISNSFSYIVNPTPVPVLTTNDSIICAGDNVTLIGTGAALYQFNVNSSSISGAPSGTSFFNYSGLVNSDTVTIIGSTNGCIGTSNTIIYDVIDLPSVVLTSDIGVSICADQTAIITATSGLATNFEFFIDGFSNQNGASNAFSPGLLSNNSIVSVTTSYNGCTDNDALTFTVNPVPLPALFSNDPNNIICENEQITFTGTNGIDYEFFVNGSSQGISGSTFVTNSLIPGNDTIYVVASIPATGCSGTSANLIVTVTELPVLSVTSSAIANTICEGELVDFEANGGANQYQFYINSFSQGLPSADSIFSTQFLSDGDILTVIGYNGNCGNPSADTIITTVNANPIATITPTPLFCEGDAVNFVAGTGTSYEFIIDGGSLGVGPSDTYDASGLPNGTHTIEVIVYANGCSDQAATNTSILDNPIISFSGDSVICSGTNALFSASGATTYEYFVNGVGQGSSVSNLFTSSTLNNGDVITLEGVSLSGCPAENSPFVTIDVITTPTVSILSDDADALLCVGQTVTFTSNGATNYEFFVNGFSVGPPSAANTFVTNSLLNGQTVSVIGEANGCQDDVVIGQTFTVSNYPVVNLTNNEDTVLCMGDLTNLTGNGATSYQYYVNGIPSSPAQNLNIVLNNGDIVTLEGTTNTCTTLAPETLSFSVFNYPNTVLTSSDFDNIICEGEEVTFSGTNAMTYEFFIDGLSLGINTDTLVTDQIEDGQIITLVGYNADCPTTAPQVLTFTVNTLNLSMSVSPANYMICQGEALTITGSGADEYEIFVNSVSQGAQSPVSTFVLNTLTDGDEITMNGFSTSTGCTQTEDEVIIAHVYDTPVVTVEFNTTICEGDSTILTSSSPIGNQWYVDGNPIPGATNQTYTVFTSGNYTLEILNGGTGEIWSVGYNANGEFGDGSNFNSNLPSESNNVTNIASVASGLNHTMSLMTTGELYISGDNSSGQLGNGTFTSLNSMTQVGAVPLIADMSAGIDYSVAVSTTGDVFVWGGNNDGQLGLGNTIVYNTPQLVVGVNGMTKTASGLNHALLLKNDGTVWSAGNNDFGQLGQGTLVGSNTFVQLAGLANIVAIEAGDYHSMAIDNNGDLFVWGDNSRGQLGLNDLDNRLSPVISALKDVKTVSGGNGHSTFVTISGKAYSCGANDYGQLGTGDFTDQVTPIHLTDLDAVVETSAGGYHSLFQKNDGSIWGAGRNDNYQLGDLVAASIETIERVPNVDGVTYIDGGNESSHFVYGNNHVCVSNIIAMNVLTAPQPIIIYSAGQLSITAVGISYQWYINGIEIINNDSQVLPLSAVGYYTVMVTYANGCTSLSDPYNYGVIGIDEIVDLTEILAYPNPTNNTITIEWNKKCTQLYLTDILGRKAMEYSLSQDQTKIMLDLVMVAPGVYSVHLIDGNGIESIVRIIKN